MSVRLLLLLIILGANGFFAAAEVSLVSVRQSRLRELAEAGNTGAQSALSLLANPGRLLSVTQFGVTLASLGLGWAGEDTAYRILRDALGALQLNIPSVWLQGISFFLSFLTISYAHVILGEVVPKNVAIEKADRLATLAAPALLVFYRLSQPFVVVIERSSALILKTLGLSPEHARGGHTPEELKYIVQSSRHEGHLEEFQQQSIQRMIDMSNYSVREIMTPRVDIVSLPVDADLDLVLATMAEHKFSRLPIYEDRPEQLIGIVHYKDVLRVWDERHFVHDRRRPVRPFRLRRFLRKPLVMPETKPVSESVEQFRRAHTRMAFIVDEFGTVAGLLTLEDIVEQVFGEVPDEHDDVRPQPAHPDKPLLLEGNISLRDLETRHQILLPTEAGFETLAGFLLFQIGHIPAVGDAADYGGRHFKIASMDRNRIATVLVEKLDPADQSGTAG